MVYTLVEEGRDTAGQKEASTLLLSPNGVSKPQKAPLIIFNPINLYQRPGVCFSKLPRTFRARKHYGALFGCFSRVPRSVFQSTRKCRELSRDIFGNLSC